MVDEITVVIGGAAGALISGVVGLLISWNGMRRARRCSTQVHKELAWEERRSGDIARNLLVLEMVGDEIESTPIDIAVRARLTPAEVRKATQELTSAGLVETPSRGLLRLTSVGRNVLDSHRFELEDSIIHRGQRKQVRSKRSTEDLDSAIAAAVASLRAQHAHS